MIEVDLTPRQREAATHLCNGLSNKDIALAMGVSFWSAMEYSRQIGAKLGSSNRTETALKLVGHLR